MIIFSLFLNAPLYAEINAGRIVSVVGKVFIDEKEAIEGAVIKVNQVIRTDFESSCKLLLADNSVLDIQPKSEFKVEKFEKQGKETQVETQINFGGLRASIQKKLDKKSRFHIKTKTSVLAVRGTELIVSLENKDGNQLKEKVVVSDGLVERNDLKGGSQFITVGHALVQNFSLNNKDWQPQQPAQDLVLKRDEVQNLVNKNFVEDKTFIRAVEVPTNSPNGGNNGRETLQFNENNHPYVKAQVDNKADTRLEPDMNPFQFRKGDPLANDQFARQFSGGPLIQLSVNYKP